MAILYPNIETIKKLHQKPTEGELALLDFLVKNLNSEFEVYFQPFINGDKPDIIVLKRNGGAIVFEVKDWNLNNYYIDKNTDWYLKINNCKIKSPLSQVKDYKDNLYNLHIDDLLPRTIKNKYFYSIISTVVYFHCESKQTINEFISDKFEPYIYRWGNDSLNPQNIDDFLVKTRLNQKSQLFDDSLYYSFKRFLQPPYHTLEEGKEIIYTKEQQVLIKSEQRPRRKIKGVAGSGKTFVLAKRAVNAYLRTNSRILILTFNLSLKNYIHDRINDVRENFPWDKFYIINYHQFIKTQAINHELEINSLDPFYKIEFFVPVKNELEKYKVILIDEIQDYKTEWLEIIHEYFLEDDGEFVVFGDEKQNIYNRELDDNKDPKTIGIPGVWNKSLNVSKRFANEIARLAMEYQREFMSKKYSVEEMQIMSNPTFDFEQKILKYYNLDCDSNPEDLFNTYKNLVNLHMIHPSDVCILSTTVNYLREIDYLIRTKMKENTTITFETKEDWDKLRIDYKDDILFKKKIEKIRRNKKNNFWMKTGTTKLSSIHSFKGWECHTVFLLIEPEGENQSEIVELIYTGLTRAQLNLFVLNMGNSYFDNFFKNKLG